MDKLAIREKLLNISKLSLFPNSLLRHSHETGNRLKNLDPGSRFALNTMRCRASLTRDDDFLLLPKVWQEAPFTSCFLRDLRRL
jgi:hypothetical protein